MKSGNVFVASGIHAENGRKSEADHGGAKVLRPNSTAFTRILKAAFTPPCARVGPGRGYRSVSATLMQTGKHPPPSN
jgi:hypothetical protein